MVTVDEFSRLVSGTYAAALTPRHWEHAIREIHRTMGGTGGSLLIADGAIWSIQSSTIPERACESYAEHCCRLDHVLASVENGPVGAGAGAVRTGTELVAPSRKSEFYAGWLTPCSLVHEEPGRPGPTDHWKRGKLGIGTLLVRHASHGHHGRPSTARHRQETVGRMSAKRSRRAQCRPQSQPRLPD
jgi:hypothetical protein